MGNAIQVSLPTGNLSRLQEFIFSAASLENDILTPFTWKSLCLFICNGDLCADRTSLRVGLLMDMSRKRNRTKESKKEKKRKERKKEKMKERKKEKMIERKKKGKKEGRKKRKCGH